MTAAVTVVQNIPVDPTGTILPGAATTIVLVTGADTSPGYTGTQTLVAPHVVYTDPTSGSWSADLIPNALITPANTYYRVTEPNGEISTVVVPVSGGPYNLSSILVAPPPPPDPLGIAVSQKGVANGVATLDGTGNVPLSELGNVPGGQTPSGTVVAETAYGQSSTAGAAATYSRGDHTHGSPSLTGSIPAAEAIGSAGVVGAATAPARADHVHAMPAAGAPTTSAVGDAAAQGSASTLARSDHTHGRESYGAVTAQTSFGLASANGTATTDARSDHTHGTPSLPNTLLIQVAPPSGSAATDTAAIQAALDAANTAGGGIVQLQAGTYLIQAPGTASSGGVRINNNATLAGYGIGVTVLQVVAGTTAAITGVVRTPNGVQTSKVTVRDLTIDGNQANLTGAPAVIGFFSGVTPNSTLTDTDIACIRVEIMNCTQYGFDPHERTTRFYALGCVSHDNGTDLAHDGFTLDGLYDSTLIGCVAYNNGRHGFNLVTATARTRLVGCESYSNTSNGIVLQNGAKDNSIVGCHVYNNTGDGILINGLPQAGQQDNNPGVNNHVKACLVELSGGHGIHLVAASHMHISGNTVRDSSQAANNTSIQIYLDESGAVFSTFNTVENNDLDVTTGVSNAPKYGIREKTSNEDNNFVVGNRSQGAQTANISLLGTTSLALAAHNGVNEHVSPATTVTSATTYGVSTAVGSAATYAREDHNHGSPSLTSSAPATTEAIGTAAAVGTGTTAARSDHVHPMSAAAAPVASAVADTQATGSATTFAASDHRHAREAFGAVTAQTQTGQAAANGTATTVSHSDHAHGTPPSVDIQTFLTSGTWTKPANAKLVVAVLVGGGGGGGSGRRGAAGSVRCGGGGGGAGSIRVANLPASILGATVSVTVGTGGTGGTAVAADNTDGNAGNSGGATVFGTFARVTTSGGGSGGTATAGSGGSGATGTSSSGSAGGSASASGGAGSAGSSAGGHASAGGAGGGISASDTANAGGAGGSTNTVDNTTAAAGVVGGATPGAGTSQPANSGLPGGGAGGGAASTSAAAQSGANGGLYGGGGGGGGASLNGNNSGAGGNGADGMAVIYSYF